MKIRSSGYGEHHPFSVPRKPKREPGTICKNAKYSYHLLKRKMDSISTLTFQKLEKCPTV
jgi:hypothetical protein